MPSVFDLLEEIRQRPTMFLGGEESQRGLQLRNLELVLSGYSLAVKRHHLQGRVVDFNQEFGAYLRRSRGWSASCGPVAAVLEASQSEQSAWDTYWELVHAFRAEVGSENPGVAHT